MTAETNTSETHFYKRDSDNDPRYRRTFYTALGCFTLAICIAGAVAYILIRF